MYEKSIHLLESGSAVVQYSSIRLVISSYAAGSPQQAMNAAAAKASFGYFERVTGLQHLLRQRQNGLPQGLEDPLAIGMIQSVLDVGDEDLTPMAAVAGVIADSVADFLFRRGLSKVVVNNGGDIAVRLREGESARIGIRTDLNRSGFDHLLVLGSERKSWGIATSGLGGRSLTRGIASAATVVAASGSLADAAATAIANASFVADPQIVQLPAEEVDPETDIPGLSVTVKLGPISPEKKKEAVSKAIARAEELVERGIVFGALVAVGGAIGMTRFVKERLK